MAGRLTMDFDCCYRVVFYVTPVHVYPRSIAMQYCNIAIARNASRIYVFIPAN